MAGTRLGKTRSDRRSERRGAAMIEMTFVLLIFLMLLFGIIEYGRLVYTREVIINATREGARYAVVNATSSSLEANTQAIVKERMYGLDKNTTFYDCQVYMSDSSGKKIGNANDAGFGSYIAVQVDYDYKPILPNFLRMNSSFRITFRDMMYSEAN
jgi:Flp pilus assembly protein TadG